MQVFVRNHTIPNIIRDCMYVNIQSRIAGKGICIKRIAGKNVFVRRIQIRLAG